MTDLEGRKLNPDSGNVQKDDRAPIGTESSETKLKPDSWTYTRSIQR